MGNNPRWLGSCYSYIENLVELGLILVELHQRLLKEYIKCNIQHHLVIELPRFIRVIKLPPFLFS